VEAAHADRPGPGTAASRPMRAAMCITAAITALNPIPAYAGKRGLANTRDRGIRG
jgi:hypothetical protein